VVFGKTSGTVVELSAIAAGTGGFVINGQCANDLSGFSVSAAGDVNGDGLADLIVGAINADPVTGTDAGRSYVVFGQTSGTAVELSTVAAGVGGFVINGQGTGDLSGISVSAAGDVNGDGLADLIVGAYRFDPTAGTDAGRSYVIFGGTEGAFSQTAVDYLGTIGNDIHVASTVGLTLVGNAGDDSLTSNGATVLYGGSGNDSFVIDAAMITALQSIGLQNGVYARIDGGSGIDTIKVSSNLDLTSIANQGQSANGTHSRIASVEVIDLSAAGDQTLTLKLADVLDMTGFNSFATTGRHQLLVKGAAGDVVDLADSSGTAGWTQNGTLTFESITYNAWHHDTSLATVYAQQGMSVI
jgi:hypothetical protein